MLASLAIFVLTLVFSLPLGLLLMFVRLSKVNVIRWIAKIYISIMRGTPLMLQLLVVFFGPYYVFGISLSYSYRFYAVIIGFALNYAAYLQRYSDREFRRYQQDRVKLQQFLVTQGHRHL